MTIRITADRMTCDRSGHVADRLPDGQWTVTSHPGHRFDLNQAITALTLAEVLLTAPPPDDPMWLHIAAWRSELGPTAATTSDGPHGSTADENPDGTRSDRASSLTNTQGTAPTPPRTVAAPRNPATVKAHEVYSS
ncbi:MAG TPA: hypothetical protein VM347_08190 [Nonomuraea sp.]|nr:hypothetical protein [Nonomuraea sp.]